MDSQIKPHLAVLMGGSSAEREVSLSSGNAVVDALRAAGFRVSPIDVDASFDTLRTAHAATPIDVAFLVLHGELGEDGLAQGELEALGIPYVGTRAADMPISFNKILSKQALDAAGLPNAAWTTVDGPDHILDLEALPLPLVVKPPTQGSSIGISIVHDAEALPNALAEAAKFGYPILVESFVPGREITVGLLDGAPLPLVEICAPAGNYDYDAKYTRGKTDYHVPAPVSEAIASEAQRLAVESFTVLKGLHLGRVDFRLTESGKLVILELNTLPGFTSTSLLPKAAASAGLDFQSLCTRLVALAC